MTLLIHRLDESHTRYTLPLKHNSIAMAIHTPYKPIVVTIMADSPSLTIHMLTRLMPQGTSV